MDPHCFKYNIKIPYFGLQAPCSLFPTLPVCPQLRLSMAKDPQSQ